MGDDFNYGGAAGPLNGEMLSSLDVGFGGAILPQSPAVLPPVLGPGDKIEEGWYDSVSFIKSPTKQSGSSQAWLLGP